MTIQDAYQLATGARVTTDAIILAEVDLGRSPYEFGQALFALNRECPADGDERRGWLDAEDEAWTLATETDETEDVASWMNDDELWASVESAWDALYSEVLS